MLAACSPIGLTGDASPQVIPMIQDKRQSLSGVSRAAMRLLQVAVVAGIVSCAALLHAEDRAVKQRVSPVYPELARRMHIGGVVRIEATVAPDGSVSATKTLSGNHMLSGAAEDAVHKWKFVPGSEESTVEVAVDFKTTD